MKEKLFTLEFNEKSQNFHHNNGTHPENTNGWITVFLYCSNEEAYFFEALLASKGKIKLTNEIVLQTKKEAILMVEKLNGFNLEIKFIK